MMSLQMSTLQVMVLPMRGSLRGSSEVVAKRIRDEIQARVENAGLEIIEARITYLAYAPEIATVMLSTSTSFSNY